MDIMIRGHRCVYERTGQGPDLTLLHSVGLSTVEGWRNQIPALSRHFSVLNFDFRGLGQSERGTESLGVTTFVRDLEDLLEKLGIDAFNARVIDFLTAAISQQAFQPATQL